ncbi:MULTISPECIES: hypothetical protein [unclassified Chelatococcus]|nr:MULTISPECIES: hypothetical protein [unclassified Chelatococcus]
MGKKMLAAGAIIGLALIAVGEILWRIILPTIGLLWWFGVL